MSEMITVSHTSPCWGNICAFLEPYLKCLLFGTCPVKRLIICPGLYANISNVHCFSYIPLLG